MFSNCVLNVIKNITLFGFLAMTSMQVQAQNAPASADTMTATETAEYPVTEDQQHAFSFPRWPESRQVFREREPLAPPGPYMSSALSDFSVEGSPFDRDRNRHDNRAASMTDSSDMSMEKFNPNTPWPGQTKSPARWLPDNGYRYIDSSVAEQKLQQTTPYPPSNYSYGYRRHSPNNWTGNAWPAAEPGRHQSAVSAPGH